MTPISGVAAGGAALANGVVRVLDASGTAVTVTNKNVTPGTGAYGPITLGNVAPYRVEACGTIADRPMCFWAVTNAGGTVHLTPLSSAVAILATGKTPDALMSGPLSGVTDTSLALALAQVRNAVGPVLSEAGLSTSIDLVSGPLAAGTHAGLDRVLDAVSVGWGVDSKPYVTVTARLGTGQVYLEPRAAAQGSLSLDPLAVAPLDLAGLDGLYTSMSVAMSTNSSCTADLPTSMDSNARATAVTTTATTVDTATATGATQAAQLHCLVLGGVLGDYGVLFGGKLLPPLIDRCDTRAGADPLCRVSLIYQSSKGQLRSLGVEQAAVRRPSGWKLLGNRLEVQASATARLVRSQRLDATTPAAPDSYSRYLDIAIPAVSALQCARVSQQDISGTSVPLALFKRFTVGRYLSLWSVSSSNAAPSLNPTSGTVRGADVIAVPVPSGAAGDLVARNFARMGPALRIELFNDSTCQTPFVGTDGGEISLNVTGALPIAGAAASGQAWPALAAASATALSNLKGAARAKVQYGPTWTLPARTDFRPDRAQLCITDASCTNKVADLELLNYTASAALSGTLGSAALDTKDYKLLRLTGRTADGLVLQLDAASCANQVAGQPC